MYGSTTINTIVNKGNNLYFRIGSKGNNDCDSTRVNINIYQAPEANEALASANTQGINSGNNAIYVSTGRF